MQIGSPKVETPIIGKTDSNKIIGCKITINFKIRNKN